MVEFDAKQFWCPTGDEGKDVLDGMNAHHAPLWDWFLDLIPKGIDGAVLDVGCGGGGLLNRLSQRYTNAPLSGIDISETSLNMTAEMNRGLVDEGRLRLIKASVDDLPYEDSTFGLVTAAETYFFWPDLGAGIREIARVLAEGGTAAIVAEMRISPETMEKARDSMDSFGAKIVEDSKMLGLMAEAGLAAEAFTNGDWVLYKGTKQ